MILIENYSNKISNIRVIQRVAFNFIFYLLKYGIWPQKNDLVNRLEEILIF